MNMKILIIEDEYKLRNLINSTLTREGHDVDTAAGGEEGFELALNNAYDLIMLDWMLPKKDGLSILEDLRDRGISTLVMMITAKSDLDDKLAGLDMGADDYLIKPFHVDELVARVKAMARRLNLEATHLRHVGNLEINLIKHHVQANGNPLEVTGRDFHLLELLSRAPGQIFTRTQILSHVWQISYDPQTNVVDVYVNRLRKKLAEFEGSPLIENVRGVGYRLKPMEP